MGKRTVRASRPAAPAPRRRDRAETSARILASVGETLAKGGFRSLGINAVAERAGVDKVLIYRYFGGLPELLAAYGEHGEFWWRADDMIGAHLPKPAADTLDAWVELVFRRHVAWLRARPVTLEIMGWETIERNELTQALADVREARGLEVMNRVASRFALPAGIDIAAVAALFGAATNYLAIRARGIRQFQGLDLGRDEGWERLHRTIGALAGALLRIHPGEQP